MIFIASKSISPRLEYISHILFNVILKTEYRNITIQEIDSHKNKFHSAAFIIYSSENNIPQGNISIPDEGLLFEASIEKKSPKIISSSVPELHFTKDDFSSFTIGFDIFSSAFYLLTEYEKYAEPKLDIHGRYDEEQYEIYKEYYHENPVLHQYAELLWKKLSSSNPDLEQEQRKFDYTITFDIDAPYLYKGRSAALQAGGFIRDLLGIRFSNLDLRMKYLASGNDPYNVYDYIFSKVNSAKLKFFFLIDRHSPHDGRHTFSNEEYKKLIKNIAARDVEIGIHPSYTAYKNADRIIFEKEKLVEISGGKVTSSRMHFLKYSLPDTNRYLIQAGIADDYTSCAVNRAGFKNFIAVPYPWFDLVENKQSDLIIHPSMVMDVTLKNYMHLNPEESLSRIKNLIDTTRQYKGHFCILMHNNTLSETPEWRGWRKVFESVLEYLERV